MRRHFPFHHLSLLFISGCALWFVGVGWYEFFFDTIEDSPWFVAIVATLFSVIVFLPRILYAVWWKRFCSKNSIAMIEILTTFILFFNGIGALGFYVRLHNYDTFTHGIIPLNIGIIVSLVTGSFLQKKEKYRILPIHVWSLSLVTISLFGWELWEYFGDGFLGTRMLGQPGEPFDTMFDILAGIVSLPFLAVFNQRYLARLLLWINNL